MWEAQDRAQTEVVGDILAPRGGSNNVNSLCAYSVLSCIKPLPICEQTTRAEPGGGGEGGGS